MKRIISFYLLPLSMLLSYTSTIDAQEIVTTVFKTPSLPIFDQIVDIYLPKGYDQDSDKKYRWMIYLHGSDPSSAEKISNDMRPAANSVFQDNQDPLVILMPNMKSTKFPSFRNLHMYANSEYYGNFEDAIVLDLIDWARTETSMGLGTKLSFDRDHMAIGGFSMGADGALVIAIKHPDLFVAAGCNSPFPNASEGSGTFMENTVKSESCGGSNCDFTPTEEKFWTTTAWGVSGAFNPLDESGNIQFILDESAKVRTDVLAGWKEGFDPSTLIHESQLFSTEGPKPFLYINMGTNERGLWASDHFEEELRKMNVSSDYYVFSHDINAPHNLNTGRLSRMLRVVSNKMSDIEELVSFHEISTVKNLQVFPSLAQRGAIINLKMEDNEIATSEVNLTIHNLQGREETEQVLRLQSPWQVEAPSNPGIYILMVRSEQKTFMGRLVVQ